jgi:AraC family transcriptional regulator of adaptative response / DNA-3-methyladenine glycosylase II
VASADADAIAATGVVASRAQTISRLAREIADGRLTLQAGADPDDTVRRLEAVKGIGPWTAQYIAMRALQWPDAFLREDVVVRKGLGAASPARASQMSLPWRPWRAYAVMALWGAAPSVQARRVPTSTTGT